jgi:hypothetical protein
VENDFFLPAHYLVAPKVKAWQKSNFITSQNQSDFSLLIKRQLRWLVDADKSFCRCLHREKLFGKSTKQTKISVTFAP